MNVVDALWARLEPRLEVIECGCWIWRGWRNNANYGYACFEGRDQPVHRLTYQIFVGPIPEGLELDHLCRNPPCANPAHLEVVTHAENQRRIQDRMTRCKRAGHDWTDPNNVYVRRNGHRWCAACNREDRRVRYAQR